MLTKWDDMHVKYRQDNLHRMTWYSGTCSNNGHGHTIRVSFMVKCMCYTGLWIHRFRDHSATIPNGSVTIGWMSLVSVGHLRSDSVVPLMLRTVCCAMTGALAWYYRSLGTAPTLLKWDNILGRLYCCSWQLFTSYAYIIYYIYIYILHIMYAARMELLLLIKHTSSLLN